MFYFFLSPYIILSSMLHHFQSGVVSLNIKSCLIGACPWACRSFPFHTLVSECPSPRNNRLVRSFAIAGRGPAYSVPQRWDLYVGPMRQPRERGIGRCVREQWAQHSRNYRKVSPKIHKKVINFPCYCASKQEAQLSPRDPCNTLCQLKHWPAVVQITHTNPLCQPEDWSIDWVVVLRPTRHKISHSEDVLPSPSIGLVLKNWNKPNKSKHSPATNYTTT